MGHMQRQHLGLQEDYYIRCFVKGLKEQIKHLLKPHRPKSLGEAYSIAKELEMYVLSRRPFPLIGTVQNKMPSPQVTHQHKLEVSPKPDKLPTISIKLREPGSCWKCGEPWTPKHRHKCKHYQAIAHALSIEPDEVHCDQCDDQFHDATNEVIDINPDLDPYSCHHIPNFSACC